MIILFLWRFFYDQYILFDHNKKLEKNNPEGNQDPLKIHDVILESAISTICDNEDSVAAVDAEDKVVCYRNWLGLMKGTLKTEFIKNTTKMIIGLRIYTKVLKVYF